MNYTADGQFDPSEEIAKVSSMLNPQSPDNGFSGSMFAIAIGTLASALVAPVAAAGIALAADAAMQNRTSSFATSTSGKKAKSIFLGGYVATVPAKSQSVSLLPATPSKYNNNLLASKLTVTRMSLTGRSQAHRNNHAPVKNAKMQAPVAELQKSLAFLWQLKYDPYTNSPKRLYDHIMKGNDNAEAYVEKNTVKVQPMFTQLPSSPQLKSFTI